MRLKFWKPRAFRTEMEVLEYQSHVATGEWETITNEFKPDAPLDIPIRRQRVYTNGHHCDGCGTPTPGPLCARCVANQRSFDV